MKKRKITYKNVFAVLFSLVVFSFFISIGVCFVRYAIFNQYNEGALKTETEFNSSESSATDWSKVYPFSEEDLAEIKADAAEDAEKEKPAEQSRAEALINLYRDKIEGIKTGIDYYASKLLVMRMNFIELNAKFNKIIGMKLVSGNDDVIVMADGNMTFYSIDADVSGGAQNITEFSEFLKEKGTELMYVQLPSKVDPDNNYLPGGIEDYDNKKADGILKILRKNGIDCLDIRKEMKKQGMNFTDSFYHTDHHWKTKTALWATKEIAVNLEKHGISCRTELLSEENYTERVFENYMFGSLGKTVTLAYADPEDFSIFYPDFETDFKVNYYDKGVKSGPFEDSIIENGFLQKPDYYNVSIYSAFLTGILPVTSIENRKAEGNQRILVIGDSFSLSVVPYLSTQVRYIDKIDSRYFNGSIKSFVEQTKPDAVVIMYYPGSLAESSDPAMLLK